MDERHAIIKNCCKLNRYSCLLSEQRVLTRVRLRMEEGSDRIEEVANDSSIVVVSIALKAFAALRAETPSSGRIGPEVDAATFVVH